MSVAPVEKSAFFVSRQACALMILFAVALLALSLIPGAKEASFRSLNALGNYLPGFWSGLSALGDTLLALAVLLPLVLLRPRIAGLLLISALIATAITHSLKPLLAIPRPAGELDPDSFVILGHVLTSQAFPSGHSVTSFVLAGLIVVGFRLVGWKAALILGGACLMVLSRVTVGAHWVTDILAGSLVGWLSVMLAAWLIHRWPVLAGGRRFALVTLAVLAGCVVAVPFFDAGYPMGLWMHGLVTAWAVVASFWIMRQRKLAGEPVFKGI